MTPPLRILQSAFRIPDWKPGRGWRTRASALPVVNPHFGLEAGAWAADEDVRGPRENSALRILHSGLEAGSGLRTRASALPVEVPHSVFRIIISFLLFLPLSACTSRPHQVIEAVLLKQHARLEVYLKDGADPNAFYDKERTGMRLLHAAATEADAETVAILLAHGAQADPRDHYGRTPLYLAAAVGKWENIAMLAKNHADVQAPAYDGKTPLHRAVLELAALRPEITNQGAATRLHDYEDLLHTAKTLLELGADPEMKDKSGKSAFDAATENRLYDLIPRMAARMSSRKTSK